MQTCPCVYLRKPPPPIPPPPKLRPPPPQPPPPPRLAHPRELAERLSQPPPPKPLEPPERSPKPLKAVEPRPLPLCPHPREASEALLRSALAFWRFTLFTLTVLPLTFVLWL